MPTPTTKITRDNFPDLLLPGLKKVFFDQYKTWKEQYSQIFQVIKSEKAAETFLRIPGFGALEENTEGSEIKETSITQGEKITLTHSRFDKGFTVTWEMMEDEQYDVMKRGTKNLSRSALINPEQASANILLGGFANTGYDGKSLFSDAHPDAKSGTQSNLATGELTYDNFKRACTQLRTQKDDNGETPISAIPKKLIVGPENEYAAKTISASTLAPSTSDNDNNVLKGIDVVVMDFLGNSPAWFVADDSIENLIFIWRQKTVFDKQVLPKSLDAFFFAAQRFSVGYVDWRGIVGSAGVTA